MISLPTRRGNICANRFGVGIELQGTYTPQEIISSAFSLEKLVGEVTETPEWIETYNMHAWIPWSRVTREYCNAIVRRVQLATQHKLDIEDSNNYLGIGPYVTAWPMYLSIAERISAITQCFTSVDGLKVLEIGCGSGHQLLQLASHGCDVYGMELNPALYNNRSPLLRDRIVFGDAMLDPWMLFPKSSFDVVIISMIGFVHYEDLIELFTGVEYITKYTGMVLVDVVNKQKSCGHVRTPQSYYESIRTAGLVPKRVFADQIICLKKG